MSQQSKIAAGFARLVGALNTLSAKVDSLAAGMVIFPQYSSASADGDLPSTFNTPYVFYQDAVVGGQLQAFTGAYLTTQTNPASYELRLQTPGGAILVFKPDSENQIHNRLQVYVDANEPNAQLGDQWITEVSEQAGGVIQGFSGAYLTTQSNFASIQFRAFTPSGIQSVQMQ